MPDVSIIIPVYNSEEYINRCILSLENQTFKNFEIIVINDGSTDKSLDILNKLAKEFNNITIYNQKNQGVSVTRNLGIQYAKAKYIMFIDNDDWVEKDYVEKFYNQIIQTNSDIVIGGYNRTTDRKNIYSKSIKNNIDIYSQLAPWAKIYRKEFLIENDIQFFNHPIGEDVYFSLLIYNKSKKINCFDYIGYNWYYNDNSVSNDKQKKGNRDLKVLELLDKIYKETEFNIYMEYFYIRYCVWFTLFTLKDTENKIFIQNHIKHFNWLKNNCPNYRKNKLLKFRNNSDLKTLLVIRFILLLQKFKLDYIFLNILNRIFVH